MDSSRPIEYPIIEALCEFHFIPKQPWEITIPGLFYSQIKDNYPIKKQQVGFGIKISREQKEVTQDILPPNIQFISSDEKSFVQLSPNRLVINRLSPYPKWDSFKQSITDHFNIYCEIANHPNIERIILRYINRFDISFKSFLLKDYFNFYPHIPDNLPQIHGPFDINVDFFKEDARDLLSLKLSTITPNKDDIVSLIFDVAYILIKASSVEYNKISDWLELAHTELIKAFKECITDKCKSEFIRELL